MRSARLAAELPLQVAITIQVASQLAGMRPKGQVSGDLDVAVDSASGSLLEIGGQTGGMNT